MVNDRAQRRKPMKKDLHRRSTELREETRVSRG